MMNAQLRSRRAILRRAIFLSMIAYGSLPRPAWGVARRDTGWTPSVERSTQQGLQWLSSRLTEEGCFEGDRYARNVAVCSLAGLAFLASGSTPGRGKHGPAIERLATFVIAQQQPNGFISLAESASHGPMYDHGFATLLLAELYGMWERADLREKLGAAVRLIISSQNKEGGWRYEPRRNDADISVTIAQLTALRAARNGGFFVPTEVVERGLDYLGGCQNSDGGFAYMTTGGPSRFPRSAAATVALYGAGVASGPILEQSLGYLRRFQPGSEEITNDPHQLYGYYYGTQAMWQAGGKDWDSWYPAVRDVLIPRQNAAGFWNDALGREYATAMSCLVLQTPLNYLPIFQR